MSVCLQFRFPLHLAKHLVSYQFVLDIFVVFLCWEVSSLRVQLGNVLSDFLEGVNIHLPDVLDQLINLLHLGLINNKFVTCLKERVNFGGQFR